MSRGRPTLIGLDLAWVASNPSGAAVGRWAHDGWDVAAPETLGDDDEILAWCDAHAADGPVVAAIDAPLIAPNPAGTARDCDRGTTSRLGRYHAGVYPGNSENCARPVALAHALRERGWSLDPADVAAGHPRVALEVYPHAAMLGLFKLDRILKYKHGPVAERRDGLADLQRRLFANLPQMAPPVRPRFRRTCPKCLAGRGLKSFEDGLDAVVCVGMAARFVAAPERCEVVGDIERGYILIPAESELRPPRPRDATVTSVANGPAAGDDAGSSTERKRSMATDTKGYVHGFTPVEQDRLVRQARFVEQRVHEGLPLHRCRRLIEVGCGVGAQTEILLRRFPELHITGIDASKDNLGAATKRLAQLGWATDRFDLNVMDAAHLDFEPGAFDGAFLCWILEHVAEPARVLSEVRRVLQRGAPVVVNEVQNMSFFLDPYSPATNAYWTAFNERQIALGGDPFVGAKLGNLLQAVGFRDIETEVRTIHLDNRQAGERAEWLAYWSELLLSAAPGLLEAGCVDQACVDGMTHEMDEIAHHPDSVFYYSFIQGRAVAW